MDDKWTQFLNSGSVFDYLEYKKNEKVKDDDNLYQGLGNKGTNDRGE